MKLIKLTQNKWAAVDDEDYLLVSRYRWYAHREGNCWYARAQLPRKGGKQKTMSMHRFLLGLQRGDGKQADHISHRTLDNQRSNLRIVTNQQNQFNQLPQKNTTSLYKGVTFHKIRRKWEARIILSGKAINLGGYDKEIDAAHAYDTKAKDIFGEHARLNFNEQGVLA